MKKWVILITIGSFLVVVCIFLNLSGSGKDLRLTKLTINNDTMGISEADVTFKGIMNDTDQIVVGNITGVTKLNNSRNAFEVSVKQHVLGKTPHEILVYTHTDLLKQGEKYLFFLQPYYSTIYDKDFYTQHPEFIIKIDEENHLKRLTDSYEQAYSEPFAKTKYNDLTSFASFVQGHFKANNTSNTRLIEYTNHDDLLQQADYALEITVNGIDNVDGISVVDYDIIKQYKGNENKPNLLLPSNQIGVDEQYLLFLSEEGESVTLTTREGSIVKAGTQEYDKALNAVNK